MGDKLGIVNSMLSAVGENKHSTLSTQHPSVLKCVDFLDQRNSDLQTTGWWFNKETNQKLLPTDEGIINIPENRLAFQITSDVLNVQRAEAKSRYVDRGSKVYDSVDHTYVINRPLWCDLVLLLDIEDLPAPAYNYLKYLCTHEFYVDDDGDLAKASKLEERANKAWVALKSAELRALGVNVFDRTAVQALQYRMNGMSSSYPRLIGGSKFYG